MKPTISVIVPIYKAEPYLHECINSVLSQTFTDLELLLVDDESPDRCPAICDKYATKDKRVRVFHKPNGGATSARKLGIDNAKGEWVAFCDADDSLPKDALEKLLSRAIEGNHDIVIGSTNEISKDGLNYHIRQWQLSGQVDNKKYCESLLLSQVSQGPASRLIKKTVINSDGFCLPEQIFINEDLFMNLSFGLRANSVYVDNTIIVYNYKVDNKESIRLTKSQDERSWLYIFKHIICLYDSQNLEVPVPTFSQYMIDTFQDVYFSRNKSVNYSNREFIRLIKRYSNNLNRSKRYYKTLLLLRFPLLTQLYNNLHHLKA